MDNHTTYLLAYHTPTQTARYATRMIKTHGHTYYHYVKTNKFKSLEYQDQESSLTK